MSGQFVAVPSFRKLREASAHGRALWASEGPLVYRAADGRVFTVPAGFETDFASVPRIPLAYWLAGDTAHLSAVLHDYLCRCLYPSGLMSWKEAADLFREAMAAEGVPAWRRWLMYRAVRHFGEPAKHEDIGDASAG